MKLNCWRIVCVANVSFKQRDIYFMFRICFPGPSWKPGWNGEEAYQEQEGSSANVQQHAYFTIQVTKWCYHLGMPGVMFWYLGKNYMLNLACTIEFSPKYQSISPTSPMWWFHFQIMWAVIWACCCTLTGSTSFS